jgi:DNA-binding MarR family transcriptional regulator
MNQTTEKQRRQAPQAFLTPATPESLPSETIVAQARALDGMFKGFARCVLIDDDPAAELPLRQLRVCAALYDAPRSMSVLSRELGFSLSAMTQIADRLERAGLVTRALDRPDRRVRRLRLTPRARRMLRLREEARIRRVAFVLQTMPDEAREAALSALDALRRAAAPEANASDAPQPLSARD